MFYTVYKFFEKRGEINRECAPYIQAFCKMFPGGSGPGSDIALWELPAGLEHHSVSAARASSSSGNSTPSSSSLTTFADLSSNASPYASPAASPFSTPLVPPKKRSASNGVVKKPRSTLAH